MLKAKVTVGALAVALTAAAPEARQTVPSADKVKTSYDVSSFL
jgi:hypothetical protein